MLTSTTAPRMLTTLRASSRAANTSPLRAFSTTPRLPSSHPKADASQSYIRGTVNDPTTYPPPNPAHGHQHWLFERLLSVALLPLTAAAVAKHGSSGILDAVLGLSLVVHSHIGAWRGEWERAGGGSASALPLPLALPLSRNYDTIEWTADHSFRPFSPILTCIHSRRARSRSLRLLRSRRSRRHRSQASTAVCKTTCTSASSPLPARWLHGPCVASPPPRSLASMVGWSCQTKSSGGERKR